MICCIFYLDVAEASYSFKGTPTIVEQAETPQVRSLLGGIPLYEKQNKVSSGPENSTKVSGGG